MSVSDKVQNIIVEQLGVEADEVTSTASFTDDLGADSLDIVELVMAFEEEFDIEIPGRREDQHRARGGGLHRGPRLELTSRHARPASFPHQRARCDRS